MRRALVLVVLTACAGASSHEPAWPKSHVADSDGGESLAPHQAHQVAAIGLAKDDDDVKPAAAAAPATEGTAAKTIEAATPTVTTPSQTPTDETINTEEIIIEIDD